MMTCKIGLKGRILVMAALSAGMVGHAADEATAGTVGKDDLVIAQKGKSGAVIVVSATPGPWEKQAAEDLAVYIERMTGARPQLAADEQEAATALASKAPVLLVGEAALQAEPSLRGKLAAAAKKHPILRADAIVALRKGNRVYLAGSNDDSHYYAVAELLHRWGCRWYMPTAFGECIPQHARLAVGNLDYAYGTPFEIRGYWVAWNGNTSGIEEFKQRNRMNRERVPNGHCLAQYTKDIAVGGDIFKVPVAEMATAEHVAAQLEERFAKGERIMLGMEDGLYNSDSPKDQELMKLQYDKYYLMQSMTDAFLEFYNNVARILLKKYPNSTAKIGFLAYSNITLPPVRDLVAEKPLVAYLAPIDFDPIHGMDDPKSPPRQEYKDIMYAWAKVMQGRLAIYDYDQGMLVWRDIPNPSLANVRQDFKHYRDAGILGVDTESRGAFATIFVNLYFRGLLMWNPDADADAEFAAFFPKFYGPAAVPMSAYWSAIYQAWEETIVTEHEHFVAPAIYTPELVAALKGYLAQAEKLAKSGDPAVQARMTFTRLGFDVLENYMAMVQAAAGEADYQAAVAAGERGLAARDKLTEMDDLFTTYKRIGEHGPAWWPGEVQQYRGLLQKTAGAEGTLVAKLPLEWAFRTDPDDVGVKEQWANATPDLTYWNEEGAAYTVESRKDYPVAQWGMLRTDLYIQAQGIRTPDQQGYTGHGWYQTSVDLTQAQTEGNLHLMFPGLFNDCWLYVNGVQVAERKLPKALWWFNDYKFEWDVALAGKLKPGANTITLRFHNPHHFGGMFRRPFLYRAP